MSITNRIFLALAIIALPAAARAASCSKANLTRCLDSACAINVSANAAARCQYCGTSNAGVPPAETGMKSVSVGASSKNTLSAKELKSAPDDPGERYAWASAECLKKLTDCTPDDIEETYDTLIEQSCRAAGINEQMAALQAAARKTKSSSACSTEVRACLVSAKRCGSDYSACKDDVDFDRNFSECSVEATGCSSFLADIRTNLASARDSAIKNADAAVEQLAAAYQTARANKLESVRNSCRNNSGREQCIETVCQRSMANHCAAGYESEKSMATLLCKFYDVACATVD